jgi:hypothetical protein
MSLAQNKHQIRMKMQKSSSAAKIVVAVPQFVSHLNVVFTLKVLSGAHKKIK